MERNGFFVAVYLFSLVVAILLLAVFLSSPIFFDNSRIWKGYYTFIIEKNEKTERIADSLDNGYFKDRLISEYTEKVSFNDFDGMKSVKLVDLKQYLDRSDPRYDRYLKFLPFFFKTSKDGKKWAVFYIKSKLNPLFCYLKLLLALRKSGIKWQLADFEPVIKIIGTILMSIYGLLIIRCTETNDKLLVFFSALGVLPWLLAYLFGGFIDAIVFFVVYPVYISAINRVHKNINSIVSFNWKSGISENTLGEVVYLSISLAVFIGFNVASVKDPSLIVRILWSVIFTLVLIPIIAGSTYIKSIKREHKLFEPVEILSLSFRKRKKTFEKKILIIGVFLLVIIFSMVFTIVNSVKYFVIPQPMEYGRKGESFLWNQVEDLWRISRKSNIPNISDYVSHRIYQESIVFGKGITLSDPEREIYRYQYTFNEKNNVITERKKRVKTFDNAWLRMTIFKVAEKSVEKMLINQRNLVTVELIGWRRWFNSRFYDIQSVLGLLILAFYLLYYRDRVPYRLVYDFRRLYERTKDFS